ncbi:MAG TPA: 50S ribosomal protein L10 [Phycisphaerales bacterium]|nr:50S ribosomal protein L10 [Phycisphaerales bacterium]HYF54336.1 50S ribosomal protein L10 [Salinarimonas sp.]
MSKAVKGIIMRDYKARVNKEGEGLHDAVLISIRGVKAVDTTRLRHGLAKQNIRITVIRNSLARKTFEGTSLAALNDLLTGASALAYGSQSVVEVARALVESMAKYPTLELKGAVLDGTLFSGKAGVTELSRFPTREEAVAQVVTLVVSPGRKVLAQVQGPGSTIAGIIKSIESKLEKGEAIAAV